MDTGIIFLSASKRQFYEMTTTGLYVKTSTVAIIIITASKKQFLSLVTTL